MAVAMLFVTSCKKETVATQGFTARMETGASHSKTDMDASGNLTWKMGTDKVMIYDNMGNHGEFTAAAHPSYPGNSAYAELVNTDVTLYDETSQSYSAANPPHYKAIYPASIAYSDGIVTLPQVQESDTGELAEYPMYAESDSKSLQFKNLCSVVKIHMYKSTTTIISKIQIHTDQYITGDFSIDHDNFNTAPLAINDSRNSASNYHTKVVTLNLRTPVDISAADGKDFYIYLPAGITFGHFMVTVYNDAANPDLFNYVNYTANTNASITLGRSVCHSLTIPESYINFKPGDLNGLFSISSNRQVSFARGNLLQNGTGNFKFADNQYDRTEGSYKWLYYWGKRTGTSWSSNMYERWKDTDSNATISNGGGSTWFCLSSDQWKYILNDRARNSNAHNHFYDSDGVLYTDGNNRCYTLGSIQVSSNNTVHGMFIFPDVFYWPLDHKQPTNFASSGYSSAWGGITLTLEEWRIVEGAGCVFLPTTGRKLYTNSSIDAQTNHGCYWSTSKNTSGSAFYTHFYHTNTSGTTAVFGSSAHAANENDMFAIRLVK